MFKGTRDDDDDSLSLLLSDDSISLGEARFGMEAATKGELFDKGVGEEGLDKVPEDDEEDVSSLENSTSTAGGISAGWRLTWLLRMTLACCLRPRFSREAREVHEAQPRVTLQSCETNLEMGELPTTSCQWTLTLCRRSRRVTDLVWSGLAMPQSSVERADDNSDEDANDDD